MKNPSNIPWLLAAILIVSVTACRNDSEAGPRTETYHTSVITCTEGGKTRETTFADNSETYYKRGWGDGVFYISSYDRKSRNITAEYAWIGNCRLYHTWREVGIEPIKNDDK